MGNIQNVVSVSGGKDSTALLLLAIERETENLRAVFADTGHEHPETYKYVRYLEQATGVDIRWVRADFSAQIAHKREVVQTKWRDDGLPESTIERALAALHPTGNPFLDLCLWKGRFPSTKARFCTTELKHVPVNAYQQEIGKGSRAVISWQGVRRDESAARANLPERDVDFGAWEPEPSGFLIYRPILDWTVDDVFAQHRKHGIDWNPLYEQGMGRVGCMPCIHARKDELRQIAIRFPEEIERVAEWERIVSEASRRHSATFRPASDIGITTNGAETLEQASILRFVEWSKTSRGGKQYDIFRSDDSAPICESTYGLCE